MELYRYGVLSNSVIAVIHSFIESLDTNMGLKPNLSWIIKARQRSWERLTA